MTTRILTAFIPAELSIVNEYITPHSEPEHSFYGVVVTCIYQDPTAGAEATALAMPYTFAAARLWGHVNTYRLPYKESKL